MEICEEGVLGVTVTSTMEYVVGGFSLNAHDSILAKLEGLHWSIWEQKLTARGATQTGTDQREDEAALMSISAGGHSERYWSVRDMLLKCT